MKHSTTSIRISLALSVGVPLALLWLLSNGTILATAAPDSQPLRAPDEVITVCLAGQCHFASIQDAVDAAGSGDIIKVAQGTYTDIHARAGVTQVVYISKTVTIQGGYATTNWTTPYPITQPTTLDAHGQGRVLYIAGNITPTIEGLHITGGNAIGLLGNPWGTRDVGSGIYVTHATPYISNNQVFSNTAANQGGGLYLSFSDATLTGNTIFGNTATHAGGGLYLYQSDNASLIGNTISANTAADCGGGVYLRDSDTTLSENSIFSNAAPSGGGLYLYGSDNAVIIGNTISSNNAAEAGGVYLAFSDATLSDNTIASNEANMAGGLRLWSSDATLNHNTVISNTTIGSGGGLNLGQSNAVLNRNTITNNRASKGGGLSLEASSATVANNLVADNRADSQGSGLYIKRASPYFLHNTVAHNIGGDGSGIYITDNGSDYSNVALTNTILVNHTVGIFVTVGNTATLDSTLWHANTTDRSGNVVHAQDHSGTPAFDADGYHLTADSAAIDEGVDTGIAVDIDGELRPAGTGYDIGADEFHPEPDISITGLSASNSSPTMFGQPTTLTATIVTGSNVVYTWTLGDGHSASEAVVTHVYCSAGAYTAVVTASNSVSAVAATTTVTITPIVYLPLVTRRWPPVPYAPTLNAINNTDGDGNYTVSWTESPSHLADIYTLEEATDAAFTTGFRTACTTAQQSCLVSGRPAGTYYYRVQGYNPWGYSGYSNIETATVLLPDIPTLNAIDNADGDGSYSVTWSTAARATSYTLQEDTDSTFGSPATVYSSAGQSWSTTDRSPGTYYYRVRANGPTGHSGWSNVRTATVTPPPSDVLVTTSRTFYDTPYSTTYLYVVGVLLNNTSSNQHIDDIVVTFYNAQGAIVGVWNPYPNAYVMSPGQRAPFKDYSSDIPVGWTRYTVEVHHNKTSTRPYSFTFSNTNYYYDAYDCLHVVGRITNSDSSPTFFLEVYATLFDAQDNIVNCDGTFPADLDPGESTTFDISICESTAGWAYFELGADSLVWQASADEVDSRAERR